MTLATRASRELVDTGTWWADGDRVCRQWDEMDEGEKACFYVVIEGRTLQVFDDDGLLVELLNIARE